MKTIFCLGTEGSKQEVITTFTFVHFKIAAKAISICSLGHVTERHVLSVQTYKVICRFIIGLVSEVKRIITPFSRSIVQGMRGYALGASKSPDKVMVEPIHVILELTFQLRQTREHSFFDKLCLHDFKRGFYNLIIVRTTLFAQLATDSERMKSILNQTIIELQSTIRVKHPDMTQIMRNRSKRMDVAVAYTFVSPTLWSMISRLKRLTNTHT